MLAEFMKWIQDPHEDWRKPVMLAAILSLFVSILTSLFIGSYSFIFLVTPDFGINVNPSIEDFIGGIGLGTTNITLKDMHHFPHSYQHPIDLIVSEAPQSLEIKFIPPSSILFKGKSEPVVVMQYSSETNIGPGTHIIKIIARGADGLERSCNFYLDVK